MNNSIFSTVPRAEPTNILNDAGGLAYARSPKEALEQYALTGCFNSTFYVSAQDHLAKALELCATVNDPAWIADLARRARRDGLMKDMPVFLLAYVATKDGDAFRTAFPVCVDNVKQLSKFTRVIRSGVLGRKSLSRRIANAVERWLDAQTDENLWWQSVGVADPSLADILRLTHPKPKTPARAALYGFISGRNPEDKAIDRSMLPAPLIAWEAYKEGPLPNVPFQLLVGHANADWNAIAERATWAQARQSLNAFGKHGVWKNKELVAKLAAKLSDPPRTMPYQILTTYQNIDAETPRPIVDALHVAMEKACANVPVLPERTLIAVDVSGSMSSASITGERKGSTSKTKAIHVAGLFASAMVRAQPALKVVAFDTRLFEAELEPRDTVMTNAGKLAAIQGGGTDCSLPLLWALQMHQKYDLIVYLSDNESWCGNQAGMADAWAKYRQIHKQTKLVCIDLTPNTTTQVKNQERTWNIGGFSDTVFELVGKIAST